MMDVLAHDIMRYEMLSEQDEYKALASVLQESESEDFELREIQLQPLPELQFVDDQFESEDPGAQSEEKERNKRYVDISLQDTDKLLQDNEVTCPTLGVVFPQLFSFHRSPVPRRRTISCKTLSCK
jgi:hypothetical protein